MQPPVVHIALPVMDELKTLPVLIREIFAQTIQDFRLYICVNQPEDWWGDPEKIRICRENQDVISMLESMNDSRLCIIDKSSTGNGWVGKNHGIGWARKTLMDRIIQDAQDSDILLSLDADTSIAPRYLESVLTNLFMNPGAVALSVPYYHRLSGDETLDRAILRYEIYMRSYAINLWRIQSPYCYTALGSAMAIRVRAYKAIGGMTPKLSGEDFYFLQKLVKYGSVIHWNEEWVFPAGRLSDRVFFGTGPALIRGIHDDWSSYPIYPTELFSNIHDTYNLFPVLYRENAATPLDVFLTEKSGELPWDGLRKNSRSEAQFVRACHEKIDGLRILQYLKNEQYKSGISDESAMQDLLAILSEETELIPEDILPAVFSFRNSKVAQIDRIREVLLQVEMSYRRQHYDLLKKPDILPGR